MKLINLFSLLLLGLIGFTACDKDGDDILPSYLELIDDIPTTKYSQDDPFENVASDIYGAWEVIGSSGGLAGGGYEEDFDVLVVKPNGIFGIIRNDSLLTTGEVRLQTDSLEHPLVNFLSEEDLPIEILMDNEKFLQFQSDTLYLAAPCCDRFDTHLKRVE